MLLFAAYWWAADKHSDQSSFRQQTREQLVCNWQNHKSGKTLNRRGEIFRGILFANPLSIFSGFS